MSKKISNNNAISGGQFYGAYTTVTLTANTDNLVITDIQNFVLIEITTTGNFNLTGIVPATTDVSWIIKIFNAGNNNLLLKNNDAGSGASYRFSIGGDKTIQPGEGLELTYRPLVQKWASTGINI